MAGTGYIGKSLMALVLVTIFAGKRRGIWASGFFHAKLLIPYAVSPKPNTLNSTPEATSPKPGTLSTP